VTATRVKVSVISQFPLSLRCSTILSSSPLLFPHPSRAAILSGYNSHYIVVNSTGGIPTKDQDTNNTDNSESSGIFDEIVIPQESQVTPAYVIRIRTNKVASMVIQKGTNSWMDEGERRDTGVGVGVRGTMLDGLEGRSRGTRSTGDEGMEDIPDTPFLELEMEEDYGHVEESIGERLSEFASKLFSRNPVERV
jgi:hypothetical protein